MKWVVVAFAFLLSGCTSPSNGEPPSGAPTVTITDPGDYSYEASSPDNASHVHDYWDGRAMLPIVDGTVQGIVGFATNQVVIAQWRPADKIVVPQGAAWVNVTATWRPATLDSFEDPELWVQTAADTQPKLVSDLTQGAKVSMGVANEQDDLPHQRLSAWLFEVRVRPGPEGRLRYNGDVTLQAQAFRGHEIPLFPGHPDQWHNRTEILLARANGEGFLTMEDRNVCSPECLPDSITFESGAIVPRGTAYVKVVLTMDLQSQDPLDLLYHDASHRALVRAAPKTDSATERTYEIRDGDADGAYALQSLWEFGVGVDGGQEMFTGTWELEAKAVRAAP